ncbi:MAG TPA: hypothetical protein VKT78_13860, partial [Fimbriimonadaceae bacterium]|nr:hypothetical protein [Fimbriimonadaceae bacterium]
RTSTSLQELRNQHQLTKPQGVVTNDIVLAWAVETAGRDLSNDTGKKQLLDKLLRSAPTFFVRANDVVTASSALDQARLSQQALQTTGEAGGPSKRDQDLERVLDTGKSFILEYRPEQCPVCEREDQVNPRIARLNERLIGLSTSKLLNEERTTAAARVRSAETQLATTVQNLQAAVTALVPDLRAVSDELLEPVRNLQGIESFDAGSLAGLKSLAEQKDAHNDRIKLQRDRVAGRISRIESLGVTLNTYNDNKDLSALYDETTKRLKTTLGVIQEMRKSFIQSELNAISGEVSSMYSSLHPSEPYAPGAMELVEGRKGSLVHKAKLGEIETIPNATFSESHIDTLALCVHLALAKRIGGRDCILLLDDVYHSVDNQHLDRMIDLLMDQSKHFQQVIMATHLLRAARRFAMNRVGKGDVDHIVLVSKWSLERGLQWRNQPLESEVLESLINNLPFDRQSVAGKTGVLMEAVLDALVCNYRCKVPKSNDGENTLSELRDGFSKTAKSFKRQTGNFTEGLWSTSGDDVALIDSWKAFDECFGVRNDVGAHWKEVGQDIPDETVEFFARSALQVINVVTCPHCRSLPRKKEGSYWTCMCKRSRFTPLESS